MSRADTHSVHHSKLQAVLRLEVPIIVLVGERSLPIDSVLSLAPGSIIELPKGAEEELELLVNNKPIGVGIPVKVGENFGIRISHIGDARERLEAMGEQIGNAAGEKQADADADALADAMLAGQV
ncbi:MAG: FliM/FliN family flagellar motor switch protein [Phycisphaeraceae bacterium]|nr:MAG: FliM/FliN family flagellar motor switch protein [Phycisphaeraceae bacterium]